MEYWRLLLSIGGALAGALAFLALVADEVSVIEAYLEYRKRIEAERGAKRCAREEYEAG